MGNRNRPMPGINDALKSKWIDFFMNLCGGNDLYRGTNSGVSLFMRFVYHIYFESFFDVFSAVRPYYLYKYCCGVIPVVNY